MRTGAHRADRLLRSKNCFEDFPVTVACDCNIFNLLTLRWQLNAAKAIWPHPVVALSTVFIATGDFLL